MMDEIIRFAALVGVVVCASIAGGALAYLVGLMAAILGGHVAEAYGHWRIRRELAKARKLVERMGASPDRPREVVWDTEIEQHRNGVTFIFRPRRIDSDITDVLRQIERQS